MHSLTYLGGAVGASLVGGLLAQLADGIVGTLGGLPAGGRRRAEATTAAAAAASGLGQHLRRSFYAFPSFRHLFFFLIFLFYNQKWKRGAEREGGSARRSSSGRRRMLMDTVNEQYRYGKEEDIVDSFR